MEHCRILRRWLLLLAMATAFSSPMLWAEEEPEIEAINPGSKGKPPDTGEKAKIKIWFANGEWHIAWGSNVRNDEGGVIKGEWHGRVIAKDGTWIRLQTKRMEKNKAEEKTFNDRAQAKENELRFTSTTVDRADGIIFQSDGTVLSFDIYESKKRVPKEAIFIGAKGQNPSAVPFILEKPDRPKGKRKSP